LVVNGDASITTDRAKIEELWTPAVEIWFKRKGKDDQIYR
jgi:general stress protein 26